jgi:hypothetical protein
MRLCGIAVMVAGWTTACGPASIVKDDSSTEGSAADTESDADTSSGGDSVEPVDSSSSGAPGDVTGPASAPPMILSLFADHPDITEDGFVVITAQVADADGLDDIVGGVLQTADGSGVFGPFAAKGEDTFHLLVSWAGIHQLEPIEFVEATPRTFLAEFVDTAGLTATATVDVILTCGGDGACDAVCTDVDDEDNCGGCGIVCPGVTTCFEGHCADNCGNGRIEPGEQCDGTNLQGFDCESLGLGGGTLVCDLVLCVFDTADCTG